MYALLRTFLARFQQVSDAEARGTQLLHANLTPSQLQQLKHRAYFEVIGGTSGSLYRIHDAASINIDELDAGRKLVQKWCFMPEGSLARGDVLLTQKVALELFEYEALSIARPYPAHC